MSITYDQIGFTNRIDLETNYAYRILFKNNSFLSIGIRGSAYYLQIRWDQANPVDLADNSIPGASMSKLFPNFGAVFITKLKTIISDFLCLIFSVTVLTLQIISMPVLSLGYSNIILQWEDVFRSKCKCRFTVEYSLQICARSSL